MAHSCPFISNSPDPEGMYYDEYLNLDRILNSQKLVSEANGNPVHDEMLFIVIHQVTLLELTLYSSIYSVSSVTE